MYCIYYCTCTHPRSFLRVLHALSHQKWDYKASNLFSLPRKEWETLFRKTHFVYDLKQILNFLNICKNREHKRQRNFCKKKCPLTLCLKQIFQMDLFTANKRSCKKNSQHYSTKLFQRICLAVTLGTAWLLNGSFKRWHIYIGIHEVNSLKNECLNSDFYAKLCIASPTFKTRLWYCGCVSYA